MSSLLIAVAVLFGLFGPAAASSAVGLTSSVTTTKARAVVDGNEIHLRAVPASVSRISFPVLAGSTNLLSIDEQPIIRVLTVPDGFDLRSTRDGLLVRTAHDDAWGYARVETADGRLLTITLLATVPASDIENGQLEGYRIGHYPDKPLKGMASYRAPSGFIRVTREKENVWISDRYRLRDIECKQAGSPRFVALRPRALIKLELLRQHLLETTNLRFERFTIMSGFRTPYYNARIGNDTGNSRHLYGDALDIYIDGDGDGNLDDLNADGVVDDRDADILLEAAMEIDASPEWGWLKGGAGVYLANRVHGPYLHLDTRGVVARWGAPIR